MSGRLETFSRRTRRALQECGVSTEADFDGFLRAHNWQRTVGATRLFGRRSLNELRAAAGLHDLFTDSEYRQAIR